MINFLISVLLLSLFLCSYVIMQHWLICMSRVTAGTKHRSQVSGHCFTNAVRILNVH